jgi:hypothetical protein
LIEGSAHAREAVDKNNNIMAAFKFGAYVGQCQLNKFNMLLHALIVAAGQHLGLDGAAEVGYLFRPLINEKHYNPGLWLACVNGFCYLLKKHGFSGFGRRHNHAPRTFADRGYKIDNPHARVARNGQMKPLARIYGCQGCVWPPAEKSFRRSVAYHFNGFQKTPLAPLARRTGDRSAFNETMLPNDARGHFNFMRLFAERK